LEKPRLEKKPPPPVILPLLWRGRKGGGKILPL